MTEPARRRRIFVSVALAIGGVVAGAGMAELAFAVRDDWAFPHVNTFVADAKLGVRFKPNARGRIRLAGNPVGEYSIDSSGHRNTSAANAARDPKNAILVVGDSHAFGLGVSDAQAFATLLGEHTNRHVINAGVPTYGPLEYEAVAKAELEKHTRTIIKTVVDVVFIGNDPFEQERPNTERHRVWDGWAVRIETAPREMVRYPARHWLMSQSHAVYWGRQLAHAFRGLAPIDSLPSEGGLRDLFAQSRNTAPSRLPQMDVARLDRTAARFAEQDELVGRRSRVHDPYFGLLDDLDSDLVIVRRDPRELTRVANGHPGDIVHDYHAEESRTVRLTTALIREASRLKARVDRELPSRLAAHNARIAEAVANRASTSSELEALLDPPAVPRPPRLMEAHLRRMNALARSHDAELVVVVVPLESQILSASGRPPSLEEAVTLNLNRDIVGAAEDMGVRAVDLAPILTKVSKPFLEGDPHLSIRGQDAAARAVAARMAESAPLKAPTLTMPRGRSRVPEPVEWRAHGFHAPQRGLEECVRIDVAREWIRVVAVPGYADNCGAVEEMLTDVGFPARPDTSSVVRRKHGVTVTPVAEGWAASITIVRGFFLDTLTVARKNEALEVTFASQSPHDRPRTTRAPSPTAAIAERIHRCTCERDEPASQVGRAGAFCPRSRAVPYGVLSEDCFAIYKDDCSRFLACVRGRIDALPICAQGTAHGFASRQCRTPCAPGLPERCETGHCVPWNEGGFCVD